MPVKIIVVDDDKTTIAILEKALISRGYWVYSARDGLNGFELIKKEKPQITIIDILIPKLSGLDILKKIKHSEELNQIKVILMTAVYKKMSIRQEALDSGAEGFIEKPIELEELVSQIKKLTTPKSSQ